MGGKLGLKEVVAMGVGGMVSGGIYAVLGVAMEQAGNAVPLSYLLAGIITLMTAYSYIKMTLYYGENGGAFSFIEHTVHNIHVAGFFGWILVVGYVGVMAMYAFAFGAFLLTGVREIFAITLPGILRPVFSVGIVAVLVGVNLVGVTVSGLYEDIMVYLKIVLLGTFGVLGVVFFDGSIASLDVFNMGMLSPVTAFAIIFVSYEGFQLLVYDYNDINNVERNLPRGMYLSILIAILLYVLISLMATLQLTPAQLIQYKEAALAAAVANIPVIGRIGFVLIILSAIKSTSSGINATLFGASRLARKISTEKELPRLFSFRNVEGVPVYSLLAMGILTAFFTAFGSLAQITAFASVAFLLADTATNYTNLRLWRSTGSHPVIPGIALGGTLVALPIVLHHLYVHEFHVLVSTVTIFVVIGVIEFIHIERKEIEHMAHEMEEELHEVEEEVKGLADDEVRRSIDQD